LAQKTDSRLGFKTNKVDKTGFIQSSQSPFAYKKPTAAKADESEMKLVSPSPKNPIVSKSIGHRLT